MDQMNYSSQTPAPAPAQPVYAKGCIGAAWEDIKATPGYVGKLLVLGLIMCVPILNFVVAGYLLHWSREVPFGGKTPMPAKYVTGKNFEFGFYAFVIALVVSLVVGIVGMVFGIIPLLGGLLYLAVMLVGTVAANLMQMRMIMGYTIGAGFGVNDVWNVAKRNWGQLLLVTLVPGIVAGLIVAVVTVVITLFAVLVAVGGATPSVIAAAAVDNPSFAEVMTIIGAIAVPTIIATLIVYVLACFVETAAQAVTVRGLGHWVARYAPEWTALSVPVPPTMPTYPQTPFPPQAS